MLLSDIIAQLQDPAFASEAMLALDDITLTARVAAAAGADNVSPGEFAMQAIGQFVNTASGEEWVTLIGLISKSDNPGQEFLRRVIANSLPDPAAA